MYDRGVRASFAGLLAACLAVRPAAFGVSDVEQVLDGGLGQPFVAEPLYLALAADGTLYIGSAESRNVVARAPDGTLTEVLGSAGDGATTAFLGGPLTVAPDGTLYAAAAAGGVLRLRGSLIEVAIADPSTSFPYSRVTSIQAGPGGEVFVGSYNPVTFQLIEPEGDVVEAMEPTALSHADDVAVDSAGTFYLSGYLGGGLQSDRAIAALAPSGEVTYLAGPGITDDQFLFFGGPKLAVDGDGNLFAADRDRIRRRTPAGDWSTLFSADDPGAPEYSHATIEVDAAGRVYARTLAGPSLLRVEQDGSATVILTAAGDGEVPFTGGAGVAVAPDGTAFVADRFASTVFRVDPAGAITRLLEPLDDVPMPAKLAARFGELWVADIAHDRVLRRRANGSVDAVLGPEGDGVHPFEAPGGIAVDAEGNLWAAGRRSDNVFRVSASGEVTQVLDAAGDGVAPLDEPRRIAVAPDGSVVVTGYGSHNVFRVAPGGNVDELFHHGEGGLPLIWPGAVATHPNGDVFVAAESDNVLRIPVSGEPEQILDGSGAGGVPLDSPDALDVGPDGTVWVASGGGYLSPSVVFQIPPDGEATVRHVDDEAFGWKDLAVGADGTAYVTPFSTLDERVLAFAPGGGDATAVLDSFGDGFHGLRSVDGLAFDGRGGLYVAGQLSHNVFRVAVPEPDGALAGLVALGALGAMRRGAA